jgi:ferritin
LAAFEAAYKHECHISECINKLVDLARAESDHATENFLQWFVTEQVEEEASFGAILERLRMVGEAPSPLLMMDRELGQRKVSLPTTT